MPAWPITVLLGCVLYLFLACNWLWPKSGQVYLILAKTFFSPFSSSSRSPDIIQYSVHLTMFSYLFDDFETPFLTNALCVFFQVTTKIRIVLLRMLLNVIIAGTRSCRLRRLLLLHAVGCTAVYFSQSSVARIPHSALSLRAETETPPAISICAIWRELNSPKRSKIFFDLFWYKHEECVTPLFSLRK